MADENAHMVTVRFEGEDLELLTKLVALERLSKSDVIRRAVRAYAVQLSVDQPPRRRKR